MKTKICLILLFTIGYMMLCSTVLNFPLSAQEYDQWCWAGATQSVFHYYNLPITQLEIAQYGTEGSNTWNLLWGSLEQPTRRGIDLILDNFAGLQSVCGENVNALPLAQIATEIDSLQPFVTRIGWYAGGGHFIDCYGYNQNDLYLMDPWPGNGYTIADYNWYAGGATDFLWTHSLILNSGVGLRAYFTADSLSGPAPMTVSFTESSLGSPTGWNWDFNNDGITDSNLQNPVINFPIHNTHTVKLTVTRGTESHSFIRDNYIDVLDNAPVIINPMPDLIIAPNSTYPPINLNDVFFDADNDSLNFTFSNSQHHIIGTIENGYLTLTPTQDWTGTTNCVVRCTDSYFHTLVEMFSVTVTDSVANEDIINVNTTPLLSVYPNPFNNETNIKIANPTDELLSLSLYNSKGQKLAAWAVNARHDKNIALNCAGFNGNKLASGIYYLKLNSKSYNKSRKILLLR